MNELIGIDPTAFKDEGDVKYLLEKFGFHEGRFIAEYPKQWARMVYAHLESLPPVAAKSAKLRFEKYRTDRLFRPGCSYSAEMSWHKNAIGAKVLHAIDDAIGCRSNDSGLPSPDDVDELYFSRFGSRQCEVPSSAKAYAKVAERLLTVSDEIAFFDPFIGSFATRFQNVLLEMAIVARAGKKCQLFRVFTMKDRSTPEQIVRGAKHFFGPICDQGIPVELFVLTDNDNKKADDHPRFLMSIKGAIAFDHGFDEETPPRPRKVYAVDLNLHDLLCTQYFEGELPFKVECHIRSQDNWATKKAL